MHSGISAGSFSLFWARLIGQVLCLLKKTPYECICIFIGGNILAPPALEGKI